MAIQKIPHGEWEAFFNSFSRNHQGWTAIMEVTGSEIGDQIEANTLPFEGISIDSKGGEPETIEVTFGENREVTHVIEGPTRVLFDEHEDGTHEGLEIESSDGNTTILRFRAAQATLELKEAEQERKKVRHTRKAGSQ